MRQAFSHRLSGMIIIDRIIKPCSRIYFCFFLRFVRAKLYKYFQLILTQLFFFATLIAVLLIADAACVRKISHIRTHADNAAD